MVCLLSRYGSGLADAVISCKTVSRSGTARFFDVCRDRVFPRGPVKLLGVFIGNTPEGPVVAYLEVCDHEVPLVMSPVMQAIGWRIVHIWVWLHLMLTFAYSGEPLPTRCLQQGYGHR